MPGALPDGATGSALLTRSRRKSLSLHLWSQWRAFDDLDPRPPGVGDVDDRAPVGNLARHVVELDPFGLNLLHERCVILHVEADVIEHASLGGRLRLVGLGEANLHARKIDSWCAIAHSRLAAAS